MRTEEIQRRIAAGGFVQIPQGELPCLVYAREGEPRHVVCFFPDRAKTPSDPEQLDRILAAVKAALEERWERPCRVLALVVTDDFAASGRLSAGEFPRWFLGPDGQLLLFDGQPSTFDGLEKALETPAPRVKRPRIPLNALPWVTLSLVAVNVLVFLVNVVQEAHGSDALFSAMVLEVWGWQADPQAWRLLTAVFLHFGLSHLFNNMIVLFYMGAFAERALGRVRYLLLYLVSGIGANLISLYWYIREGELLVQTAGASGAVFGISGCLVALVLLRRGCLPELTPRRMVFMLLFTLYHGMSQNGVNNVAHFAGALIGFLLGLIFALAMEKERKAKEK